MFELLLIVALTTGDSTRLPLIDLKYTAPLYKTEVACVDAGIKAKAINGPQMKGYICRFRPDLKEV